MKITKYQDIINKILISKSLFLGGGVSIILTNGQKDTWISVLIGFLIGICFIYLYTKLSSSINGSLRDYLQKKTPLNILIRIILLLLFIFMIFYQIIAFATFIYSYYLPFTKAIFSCLPFLLLAVFLGSKGVKSISRVAVALFGITIFMFIIKALILISYIDFQNFLPIFTIKPTNLFITALNFAVLTTTPYLLMIDEKSNLKNNLISYTWSFITLFIMFGYIIGSFGSNLVMTFSYPEFTVLRLINFFNFIQNIESFLAINWLIEIFIALAFASKKIKDVCFYKNNIFTYLIVIIILIITNTFVISNYITSMAIYHIFTYVFLAFEIIIFLLLGIKKGFNTKSNVKSI